MLITFLASLQLVFYCAVFFVIGCIALAIGGVCSAVVVVRGRRI